MDVEERIARISEMESALNEVAAAMGGLEDALQAFEQVLPALSELNAYYGSPTWFGDRDADESGVLPPALARGVLGEDEAYNLLTDCRALAASLSATSDATLQALS